MDTQGDTYHKSFTLDDPRPYRPNQVPPTTIARPQSSALHPVLPARHTLPPLRYQGTYALFYRPCLPEKAFPAFRFGKARAFFSDGAGSRGVELLSFDPHDPLGYGREMVDFIFRIHPLSNLLVLERASENTRLEYFVDGAWLLAAGAGTKSHVMHQRVNKIRVGGDLEYEPGCPIV